MLQLLIRSMVAKDAKKLLIIKKVTKALEADENLTRSEFQNIASKIFSEVMKVSKSVAKDDLVQEKPKRGLTLWNKYLQIHIARMKAEDNDKPKNEKRTSRDMFKLASENWKTSDRDTFEK